MTAIPLKPQHGPTLGRLLEPRWRVARPLTRALVTIAGVLVALLLIVAVLSLLDASYSHGGHTPFGFRYRGLYRTTPDPGGYVKVARHSAEGGIEDSFAVAPLRLPPYAGSVTGELPLRAAAYVHELRRRFAGFRLQGEGKTRITSTLAGYDVRYSALVEGRRLSGRDVILMPKATHPQAGVVLEMLTSEYASVAKPVATQGVLEKPLKTFSFG
ncbi:MAG TPA: hypothetical protein VFW38_06435 [Solirubrobacteraceae bacterium]|nr:hypothetical protein [Solirubrobacteraceae bacterium]